MNIDEAIMRCKTQRKCSRDVKFPYLFVVEIQTWISCPQNRAWPQMISILSCGLTVYFKGLEWKCLDWTLSQCGDWWVWSTPGRRFRWRIMMFTRLNDLPGHFLPLSVSLWQKGAYNTLIHRSFLCMEATFTMPWQHSGRHSIVRFHQSEHSISTDLDQWECSTLLWGGVQGWVRLVATC